MGDKSRADLDVELEHAQQAKLAAEDRLAEDRLTPLNDQLSKAEQTYQELHEEYDRAVASQSALQSELAEATTAADDIETLSEELFENDKFVMSLRGEIDNNTAAMAEMHQQIGELKAEYDVRREEVEMAKLNDEHTALLERRMQVMETRFNEIVEELRQLEATNENLTIQLQEAEDARESSAYILEDVEDRFNKIMNLEAEIAGLDATIEDKRGALETHWDLIEELKEDVERISAEVEEDNSIVAEQTATLASVNEELANYEEPAVPRDEALESLVAKLHSTTCHEDVHNLREDLGKLGFTIQMTTGGRAVLCRVNEGKMVTDKVLEDFVFVGDPANIYEHFTDGTVDKIVDFVKQHASVPCQCESKEPIMIVNEDKQLAVDILSESRYEA